ncbi:hypothetical protein [Methylobacterium planeticum]|uniref:Uncharacterized protein n=1 Tax=Methylobacterium planeticum TaxID=2615211 RepID=A0A6N6MNF5_9HYPH|nr:hypothetical protein [Methylobacterium planeticum]KAB1069913.1 hypothetical protein F6X51_24700 [Methylobacterium planeticum]
METLLLPSALSSLFVVGCLTIKALSRWPDQVRNGLAICLVAAVSLIFVEVILDYAPRQSAHRAAEPVASATALYGGVAGTHLAGEPE